MLTRMIPLLVLSFAGAASAQTPTLTPNTPVLITKIPRGQLTGRLHSWSADSILVETSMGALRAIPLSTVRSVSVPERRSPLNGAAHYGVIGGAIGGLFAWALAGRSPGDSQEKLLVASSLAVRTAAIGALIGLAAPGERWAPVTLPPRRENDSSPQERWDPLESTCRHASLSIL